MVLLFVRMSDCAGPGADGSDNYGSWGHLDLNPDRRDLLEVDLLCDGGFDCEMQSGGGDGDPTIDPDYLDDEHESLQTAELLDAQCSEEERETYRTLQALVEEEDEWFSSLWALVPLYVGSWGDFGRKLFVYSASYICFIAHAEAQFRFLLSLTGENVDESDSSHLTLANDMRKQGDKVCKIRLLAAWRSARPHERRAHLAARREMVLQSARKPENRVLIIDILREMNPGQDAGEGGSLSIRPRFVCCREYPQASDRCAEVTK